MTKSENIVSKLARILVAVSSVLLAGMCVLPIWSIGLVAPQYPEGLGMVIRINTVTGARPTDLLNINELNHYIGMKLIDPAAIPELRYMPWIVGVLVVLGLLAAASGRRGITWGWLGGIGLFAIAGLVDFWRWTYDFGHNLDTEHAIIKVPGMVYQPPIIGTKQILNFTASSWPASGTWLAVLAVVLGLVALYLSRGNRTFVIPHERSERRDPMSLAGNSPVKVDPDPAFGRAG
jgi:copper chaperone NosL